MYRNITYDRKTSTIKMFTWDDCGNRVTRDYKYHPYYFTETGNKTEYKSIFGGNLKKHEFPNDFERSKSIKLSGNNRIYGNLPVTQQFLIDAFWKHCKSKDFSLNPLSIFYIDIEAVSNDGFPDPWETNYPINVITIYNSLKNEFRVWCLEKPFNSRFLSDENKERYEKIKSSSDIKITYHETEKELLESFLVYWKRDYPDIVTGWNLPFDIPYIANRVEKILGKKYVKLLSPTGNVYEISRKQKVSAQHDVLIRDYRIDGISILDYKDVYVKFDLKPRPNNKLDTILDIEIGKGKVSYGDDTLYDFSKKDWDSFVFYNIEDVNGIRLLNDKLKFLDTCRIIGYMGLTSFDKSLSTVPIINGYVSVNALEEGKIIPTYERDGAHRSYDGAYVKEPQQGLYEYVVSYDLNSLYPMTIITLNISPETKFGKVRFIGNDAIVEDNVGKETRLTRDNFDKLLKTANLAISKSNILFTQDRKGIFPKLVEEVYSNRVEVKKQLKELKLSSDDSVKDEIDRLSVFQNSLKVILNSLYGYCGNQYAPMSDVDIAESVTITCQSVIKESSTILNKIIEGILDVNGDDTEKYVIYNDTDSVYITIKDIISKYNLTFYTEEGMVYNNIVNICEKIEALLNTKIKEWGNKTLNSNDCRFEFKMEAIADKAIFCVKKHYIMHILSDEGVDIKDEEKRWKYKGVKLASALLPKQIKELVKDIVHTLVLTVDKDSADYKYRCAYNKFKELRVNDICMNKSVNTFNTYVDKCDGWRTAPRMSAHARGAYYYNLIIKDLGLNNKYEPIVETDKIKFVYVKSNNRYGIDIISFTGEYPKEFEEIFEVDNKTQFEKAVKDSIKEFYNALSWSLGSPDYQVKINIENLFD